MSRDDDFDLPDLGPAEPERIGANNRHVDVVTPPAQTVKRSGGWFTSLMLILLVAACSGLGYWGLTMFEQLQAERKAVAELQQQMQEMRELLNLAESSAQKSGDTLLDQLTSMSKAAQDKYKHFDSEIAKLWTVAYQTNKPELEKQGKLLSAQNSQLAEQKKQLADQGKQLKAQSDKQAGYVQQIAAQKKALDEAKKSLAAQNKKLTAIDSKLSQNQSSVKSLVDAELKKSRSDLAATQTAIRLSEEALTEEVTALTTSMRKLTDRIAAMENAQRQNGLERRVKNNEDAVKSYDATRRELNRSLLQIRKKINELQLKLEKRA